MINRKTSPSPAFSPSPGSPAPFSEFIEQGSYWEIHKHSIADALSTCKGFCGVIAIYCSIKGDFVFASLLIVFGFILDALTGPIARLLKCNVVYFDNLADVVIFSCGGAEILLSYFQKNDLFWIGIALSALHFCCSLSRLALCLSEGSPPGVYRGLPSAVAGGMIAALCCTGIPYKWIIVATVLFSFFMLSFETIYVKPLAVKSKVLIGIVYLSYLVIPAAVAFFPDIGNVVVAGVLLVYGTIPVVNRFYRWFFKHSKYPGEFDFCITVGVYDMFHEGHYELFAHMSVMARKLLVAVHDDESVFGLKAVHVTDKLDVRMANVRKMRRIRKVFPINSMDPSDSIRQMLDYVPKGQTVCYMRGDDWFDFPGRQVLEERQVPIIFHHYTEGVSSSLLRLARQRHSN